MTSCISASAFLYYRGGPRNSDNCVSPNLITRWKRQAADVLVDLFSGKNARHEVDQEARGRAAKADDLELSPPSANGDGERSDNFSPNRRSAGRDGAIGSVFFLSTQNGVTVHATRYLFFRSPSEAGKERPPLPYRVRIGCGRYGIRTLK